MEQRAVCFHYDEDPEDVVEFYNEGSQNCRQEGAPLGWIDEDEGEEQEDLVQSCTGPDGLETRRKVALEEGDDGPPEGIGEEFQEEENNHSLEEK